MKVPPTLRAERTPANSSPQAQASARGTAAYYPAFLDLSGRLCLVVGGGTVAQRKAEALLEAGALVTVVSPRLTKGLKALAEDGAISAMVRRYRRGDLRQAVLVVAATNNPTVNQSVAADASRRGILVNVVDEPALCSFIVPAVVKRGDLVLAISTGGKSPAVAKRLRRDLESWLDSGPAQLLGLAAEVRQELRAHGQRPSPRRWQSALDNHLMALVREGKRDEARRRLLSSLVGAGEGVELPA